MTRTRTMTSKLYLTKRRDEYYYIGFCEGNHRKWKTTKCSREVLTNLRTNKTQKWVGMRGVRGKEAKGQKHRTPSHGRGSESAPTPSTRADEKHRPSLRVKPLRKLEGLRLDRAVYTAQGGAPSLRAGRTPVPASGGGKAPCLPE